MSLNIPGRNRQLAKDIWHLNSSDDGSATADLSQSLAPVLDPAFTESTVIADPVSSISTTSTVIAHNPPSSPLRSSTSPEHIYRTNSNGGYSDGLPDIPGDLEAVDFAEWGSWSAHRRVAAVRRWIIYASHKYGPVERWAEDFSQNWGIMRHMEVATLDRWLDSIKQMIRMGRCALSYLERAMEGELPAGADAWRDLYAQCYQLGCQLWGAVLGVQHRLDNVILARNPPIVI